MNSNEEWTQPAHRKYDSSIMMNKFPMVEGTNRPRLPGLVDIILLPDFVRHWSRFRDDLPLSPDVVPELDSPEYPIHLNKHLYLKMDCSWQSRYDDTTTDIRQAWQPYEHFEYMVLITRSLACPGGLLHEAFSNVNAYHRRKRSLERIDGIAMVCSHLIREYVGLDLLESVLELEAAKPATNPQLSPLIDVRMRWDLEQLDAERLRREMIEKVENITKDQVQQNEELAKEFYVSWMTNNAKGAGETLEERIRVLEGGHKRSAEDLGECRNKRARREN